VLETVRHDTKGESLNLGLGLFGGGPISENAREVNDFGNPATVFFLLNFYSKLHVRQILRLFAALEKASNAQG
jgi:hypothetical protein